MSGRRQPEKSVTHDDWTLTVAPDWEPSLGDVARALRLLDEAGEPIHDSERSTVWAVRHGDAALILKRSKMQERRPWLQLLSLVRGGEGSRSFRNLRRLSEAGFRVPEPIMALDRRRFGFVVESWHAYRRLDGDACTCADAALIARTLRRLHDAGWVHRDPHVKNFLTLDGEIGMIDCVRARPWRFGYARRYDVVLLNKCCPGARVFYPGFSASDPLYVLAQWHNRRIVQWRRVKRTVRGWLGVKPKDAAATPADGTGGGR